MDEDLENTKRVPPDEGFGQFSLLLRLSKKHSMRRTRAALKRLFGQKDDGKRQGRDTA
jgi:hypothetical protein